MADERSLLSGWMPIRYESLELVMWKLVWRQIINIQIVHEILFTT